MSLNARSTVSALGCLVFMIGIAAECGGNPASGGSSSSSDIPSNGLIVSGAVTEIVTFDAYSCPDELMGKVTSGGSGPVDLSFRGGAISFSDRDGTMYTGTGNFVSDGSGGMTIDAVLMSSAGKTIHLRGRSPCK